MNDILFTAAAIGLAVVIAMAFTAWRIDRIQYPRELRWPTQRRRRRSRRQSDPVE